MKSKKQWGIYYLITLWCSFYPDTEGSWLLQWDRQERFWYHPVELEHDAIGLEPAENLQAKRLEIWLAFLKLHLSNTPGHIFQSLHVVKSHSNCTIRLRGVPWVVIRTVQTRIKCGLHLFEALKATPSWCYLYLEALQTKDIILIPQPYTVRRLLRS